MNLLLKILSAPLRRRLRRLKKERPGEGFDTFLKAFERRGISQDLLREAYRYFQHVTDGMDFPVRPSDGLYEVFGIAGEDVDDTVLEIARRSGCEIPTAPDVRHVPRVRTVEDVIMLLARHP